MSSPCLTCGRRNTYRPKLCCAGACYHVGEQEEFVKIGREMQRTKFDAFLLSITQELRRSKEKEERLEPKDFDEELKQILKEHQGLFSVGTESKKRIFRKIARDAGWTESEIKKAMKTLEEK